MFQHNGARRAERPATDALASAIARHAGKAGDHETAIPALSLHRRHGPTEPMPCIYPLSLALTTQGDKRVLIGDKIFDYFPGQSLLTTIDLPAVSYVTRATTREPYLGLLLRLDARSIALAASEMKLPRPDRNDVHESVSIENLDPGLLDALRRLVDLLDDPLLLPRLALLIQQEIIIRLLTGPHGPHLRQLVADESPSQQISRVVALDQAELHKRHSRRRTGSQRKYESFHVQAAFSCHHGNEPIAISKAVAPAGSAATDVEPGYRGRSRSRHGRLRKRLAIQPRV